MKKILLAAIIGITSLSASAFADMPGRHPAYIHALSDLRAARWMLEHRPGDPAVSSNEDVAIQQIDAAINDIVHASIDDGKNINYHPGVDVPNDHPGRLHEAKRLLQGVRSDVAREEDDPMARGLKHRSLEHVNVALKAINQAIFAAKNHI
jgi:hypothetical protein